ncbi:M24 family metallopeptidase [Litorivicinus lipolyticus]|uniref:Xaa-Pro aminopeptidase n=1 Tax=Litorivicinus lipolyticus TaxID=418701 RepID=A0A5Q2QD22_9GAMM|nr:aminopeptidase P N-terminal domain-containing protein [Litorivicinus lipolyticus]QGG81213.1 M24 family metallopeptidase [Litorivicinus lipolyticus]
MQHFEFDLSLYQSRRAALQAALPANGLLVLVGADEMYRNADVDHPFRQTSDFLYLSGFEEPDAALILTAESSLLLCRPKDETMETWTGFRWGPDAAAEAFGFDHAACSDDLAEVLAETASDADAIGYAFNDERAAGLVQELQAELSKRARQGVVPAAQHFDANPLIHEARLIKSADELAMMRRAGEISARAHRRAMVVASAGVAEYRLQAEIEFEHRVAGSKREAYQAIVAGGDHANTLHYVANDQAIADGELVLIDAGCELNYYAADITRTFPVNGVFSPAQRRVYQIVLDAQLAALEQVRAGRPFNAYHDAAVRVLVAGMVELGLLQGDIDELIEGGDYRRYYMHRTGHWLGMDVHDVGRYADNGEPRALRPGMVLTVEPGLYIRADDKDAPAELRGIGIRIEDDVAVTDGAPDILTAAVPKSIDGIEALMASGSWA